MSIFFSTPYAAVSAGSLKNLQINGGKYGYNTTLTDVTVDNSELDNTNVSTTISSILAFKTGLLSQFEELGCTNVVINEDNTNVTILPTSEGKWYTLDTTGSATYNLTFKGTQYDTFYIYNDSYISTENINFILGDGVQSKYIFIISTSNIQLFGGTLYGNLIASGFYTNANTTIYGSLSATDESSTTAFDGVLTFPDNNTVLTTINYVQPTLTLTYRRRQLNRSIVQTETSALRKAYHARADLRDSLGAIVGFIETFNRVAMRNGLNTFDTATSITLNDGSTMAVNFSYSSTTFTLSSTVKSVASAFSGNYIAPPLVKITPLRNQCVVTITDAANVRVR